jgi:DNA-binding response OmpR family regulator
MADEHFLNAIVVKDSPPRLDGFKLCQPIRRIFNLPLILLGDKQEAEVYSSSLDVPTDWDYYMQLPINYDELAARIKVLLWRYEKAELRL